MIGTGYPAPYSFDPVHLRMTRGAASVHLNFACPSMFWSKVLAVFEYTAVPDTYTVLELTLNLAQV